MSSQAGAGVSSLALITTDELTFKRGELDTPYKEKQNQPVSTYNHADRSPAGPSPGRRCVLGGNGRFHFSTDHPLTAREGKKMFTMLKTKHGTRRSAKRSIRAGVRQGRKQSRTLVAERLEDRQLLTASISVADSTMNEIGGTSAFVSAGSGGLSAPKDLVPGPDGNLYVASAGTDSVLRYNAGTGQLIDTFVTANSGGIDDPFGLAFGPDGNLYVGSASTHAVYRYNGANGAFIDTYVSAGTGGLNVPRGVLFGVDGNLYVASSGSDSILRYQGPFGPSPGTPLPTAGQSGATFVAAGSGGLDNPLNMVFGPDSSLFVASTVTNNAVLHFAATDGSFLGTYIAPAVGGLGEPRGLAFDQDGRLYVADVATSAIHRFDNQGQFLDDLVASTTTDVRAPIGIIFDAQGRLLISSRDTNAIARYDSGVTVTLSEASSTSLSVSYATADGTATASIDYSAQTGAVTFARDKRRGGFCSRYATTC